MVYIYSVLSVTCTTLSLIYGTWVQLYQGTQQFPAQGPVTRSFDVFFDLRLNKRLSKQSPGWWFETPSWWLWRHCNESNNAQQTHFTFCVAHCIFLSNILWLNSFNILVTHSQTAHCSLANGLFGSVCFMNAYITGFLMYIMQRKLSLKK